METSKYLIESAGVSIDAQNLIGNTALIIAAEKGDLTMIEYLVEEAGAMTDLENDVRNYIYSILPFIYLPSFLGRIHHFTESSFDGSLSNR